MRFISKELSDAAKAAMDMEDEGYAVYVEAANRSKNPLGKATLLAIAEKEKLHKRAIEELYLKMTGSPVPHEPAGNLMFSEKIKAEILSSIRASLEKGQGIETELINAYEVSMELEKKSHDFYRKTADETEDQEAKDLFLSLAKEENAHFEILQDTYLYLNDPAEWFHKEEKWLVEG